MAMKQSQSLCIMALCALMPAMASAFSIYMVPRVRVGAWSPSYRPSWQHASSVRVSLRDTSSGRKASLQRGFSVVMMEAKVVEGVAVIVLAGGVGSRMKADRPKQFLELEGKPMLMHSVELFTRLKGIKSVTIVIAAEFRDMFDDLVKKDSRVNFADPGKERQDSVFNGLQQTPEDSSLVCVHDAARPLVTEEEVYNVISDANEYGAAVLAVPMKATVKESEDGKFVLRTIERARLWEIHTPQVIRPELLRKGFEKVQAESLEVTDDVSIIEQIPAPVKITVGEYTNIKVTTPEDMPMASSILASRRAN